MEWAPLAREAAAERGLGEASDGDDGDDDVVGVAVAGGSLLPPLLMMTTDSGSVSEFGEDISFASTSFIARVGQAGVLEKSRIVMINMGKFYFF